MFEPGFQMLDVLHMVMLLAACFFCYMAGKLSGARALVATMLAHKIINQSHLRKLEKKLLEDE